MNFSGGAGFDHWKQRSPAFLVHIETPWTQGSGIQVDASHVVTCAHVVFRGGPDRFYDTPEELRGVVGQTATIVSGGFSVEGTTIAQKTAVDLALLRLSKPRPGIALPPPSAVDYRSEAWVAGVKRTDTQYETTLQKIDIDGWPAFRGETALMVKHDFGAMEGASGGGVFADRDGALLFVGIASLGGERSRMGAFIPGRTVIDFIKATPGLDDLSNAGNSNLAHLTYAGIAPSWEMKAHQLKIPFVAVIDETIVGAPRVSFVSRCAMSMADIRLVEQQEIVLAHHRLPHFDHVDRAEAAIEKLSRLAEWQLRLPTSGELQAAWSSKASKVAPQGRPLVFSDFERNGLGIDVPPLGIAEWAREGDRSLRTVGWRNGVGLSKTSIGPRERQEQTYCFRLAFDLEGT